MFYVLLLIYHSFLPNKYVFLTSFCYLHLKQNFRLMGKSRLASLSLAMIELQLLKMISNLGPIYVISLLTHVLLL